QGTASNRSAIGARVKVKATIDGNAVWQMREVTAQSGHCSQNSLTVHFGLGDATVADSVMVLFPAGNDTVLLNVAADQLIDVIESSVTAVDEVNEAVTAISCYPNPAHDSFLILLGNKFLNDEKRITLYDTTGRIVHVETLLPGVLSFAWTKNLPSGIYIIEVSAEREMERIKLIVE
ncbi:MAG: ASPIC/UnbV domain-containing protein, partial [Chitinophagales bacterium]|nr:ASPIC/UnbV domain-containing protein [Chitinophagales bacterium]